MFWHQSLLSEDMQGKSLVLWAYILVRRTVGFWRGGEGGAVVSHVDTLTSTRAVHTKVAQFVELGGNEEFIRSIPPWVRKSSGQAEFIEQVSRQLSVAPVVQATAG